MSTSDGIKTFVEQLHLTIDKLDVVLSNAGMLTPSHSITSDGFEEMFQVNLVSTVFLATLLLPMLITTSESMNAPTHLTFVSSRAAIGAAMPSPDVQSSTTPIKDLSQASAFPKGPVRSQNRYAQSKLFLEFAIRHLSRLLVLGDNDGKRKVIVNFVCPGACKTNIVHHHNTLSFMSIVWYVFGTIFLKPAVRGADACLTALTAGEESHGRLWRVTCYVDMPDSTKSAEGLAFGEKLWRELEAIMTGWEPSVKSIIQGN